MLPLKSFFFHCFVSRYSFPDIWFLLLLCSNRGLYFSAFLKMGMALWLSVANRLWVTVSVLPLVEASVVSISAHFPLIPTPVLSIWGRMGWWRSMMIGHCWWSMQRLSLYGGRLPWEVIWTQSGLGMSENLTLVGLSHWSLKGACYDSWVNHFWELNFFFWNENHTNGKDSWLRRMGSL